MKKLIMMMTCALLISTCFAHDDLSPAEREMVDIAKEKLKEMQDKKKQHPVNQRLKDRMQSETDAGVTVEVPKKK